MVAWFCQLDVSCCVVHLDTNLSAAHWECLVIDFSPCDPGCPLTQHLTQSKIALHDMAQSVEAQVIGRGPFGHILLILQFLSPSVDHKMQY